MKTILITILILHSGTKIVPVNAEQINWLDKFGCHVTRATAVNNQVADNAIQLLEWRKGSKAKADTIHIKK